MADFTTLNEAIFLEILHNLTPEELGPVSATATFVNESASSSILWYRIYSSLYRGNFTPPPTFQELVAGSFSDLDLACFPWKTLTGFRAGMTPKLPLTPSSCLVGGRLQLEDAPVERCGMIGATHVGELTFLSTAQCMILRQPLKPMPLARPVAYVELLVHGGASMGLVDSCTYDPRSHIGWRPQSLGYHGDEGSIYFSGGYGGRKFGPSFGLDPELVVPNDATKAPRRADVVGVGIDHGIDHGAEGSKEKTVFFTKNGELVGSMVLPNEDLAFFAFALHRKGDRASVNVGSSRFYFDIESYSRNPQPAVSLKLEPSRSSNDLMSDSDEYESSIDGEREDSEEEE